MAANSMQIKEVDDFKDLNETEQSTSRGDTTV